jgi:hypothetical protein
MSTLPPDPPPPPDPEDDQPPLPDPGESRPGFARADGSDTMHEAAEFQRLVSGPTRVTVLGVVRRRGQLGATDDELERLTGMLHQSASARRRELVQMGWVEDSGARRQTRSGRNAAVWVLTERARAHDPDS